MKIAVMNAGSSSLKCKVFDMPTQEVLYTKLIEHIGEEGSTMPTHQAALESLEIDFSSLDAIGHRVVHGGEKFFSAVEITQEVQDEIERLTPLAPLHNGANLRGIQVCLQKAPNIPQVAVFDTAFHETMPKEAYLYAIPLSLYKEHAIRRYGFHGSSHLYLMKEAARRLKKDVNSVNLITLHLGNGASACAIENGKSIDTSMGFTPLEGLMMGSRSGDIDPSIVLFLQREMGMTQEELDSMLNQKSGLLGICAENDLRNILTSEAPEAQLALKMMIRRIQKYIGGYMALLGQVDALVFSGGIGEHSEYVRQKVMQSALFKDLDYFVIETDEELEIAQEVFSVVTRSSL